MQIRAYNCVGRRAGYDDGRFYPAPHLTTFGCVRANGRWSAEWAGGEWWDSK